MSVCTVNGREHQLEERETVARLLERLGFTGPYALVERNGEPVDRADYSRVVLELGDKVLVARPVAGG
ncbi:MAG TPA: sulfur carrier protein ThiS [Gaiellaceae bacterium]|nr:sulfur carrier protein ThiS [Gaiellaceae bacterium]